MKYLGGFNAGRDVGISYKASAGGGSSASDGVWDGTIEYPLVYMGFYEWYSVSSAILVCVLVTLLCLAAMFFAE